MGAIWGAGGDARKDHVDDLIDAYDAKTPGGHRSHRTQSDAANAEFRAVSQSDTSQRNEQDQRLECYADRPCTGGKQNLIGGPETDGLFRSAAEQRDERAEADAADDIRTHRAPCVGDEMVLGRQNLPDHRIKAIEENLRHAP